MKKGLIWHIAAISLSLVMLGGIISPLSCSCTALTGIPPDPYGLWYSEDPDLTLHIDPGEYGDDHLYPGIYVADGEPIEVFIGIDMNQGGDMSVYDSSAITESGIRGDIEFVYFNGHIQIWNEKMIFSLREAWTEKTGYKTIVFEKIGEYAISSSSSTAV